MKYFSIILLVLISLNFIVPSKEQRITTIQLDGVQYFVSRMNPYSPELNFYLSYQYCRSLGLQLASFETREKADSIAQYLSNAGYTKYDFWTSGNKLGTDMFLWMSTGLPFNATFNYLKHDETAAQPSDVINSNTAPQRTARESSDSGSSTGCISLKAPSFEWSTDDCTAIKDFICEQTRCYYYNYGSIPVSSAQGIKPVFLEKKPENKRKPSTTSEKTPENLETEKTITIKDILRNPKVPAGRKSMEKFDSDLQATTSSIITENSDETIANNVSVTSVNDTPAEMRDAEEAPIKKQNSVDVYIDKFFDFLNIKLTTEAPEEVEPEVEAAEPETETEKSYIEKLIDYYNLGLSTERPEKLGNEQENSENGTIFEKLIDFLNTEKVNTSLDIDAIPGYHDIKKLFEDTYTHKVPENTDDAVESENEETTKKSIFEEFIDLYNTKSHDIQAILDESYVQKVSEKQNTETSEPEEETSTHKSVLQELFDLYNNGRSLEEKNNNSNQNQIIALILEKVNRGKSIDVADFKKIPELQHIKKIAEDVYLEKVQEKVTEKPIDVTEKPARIDGVFKGLEAHLELPENIAKRSTQRQAKYLEVSPQPYLDIFATVGPYDNDGQMQDEPIANSPDNPEDNYVSTISPEYITTFKTISYT